MEKKCLVLFSGGLDSRLAVKIMQDQGFEVYALYFLLPFSKDETNSIKEFAKKNKVRLEVINCRENPC